MLIFHAASVGPLIGQRVHFEIFAAHKDPIAIERYRRLTHEAYATLDQHLASGQPHFAGDEYSIADIAHFGWTHIARLIGFDFDAYPHLSDWHERIALRPAVQRGIMLPEPAIGAVGPPEALARLPSGACLRPRMSLPEALTRSPGMPADRQSRLRGIRLADARIIIIMNMNATTTNSIDMPSGASWPRMPAIPATAACSRPTR